MSLSIVIPIYNEAEVLPELAQRIKRIFNSLPDKTEVLLVDDGSDVITKRALSEIQKADSRFKVITLSRNFGHQQAITAGLALSKGEAVAIMDGDLQDPPELLPEFLRILNEGHDIVYGVRKNRKESWWLRGSYHLFYRGLSKLTTLDIPLDAGDFGVLSRRVVDLINNMPETNRYVRGLRAYVGFNSIAVPYERQPRASGQPKFTISRLFNLASDGVFMFSSLPLRVATVVGVVVAIASIFYGIYLFGWRIFADDDIPGFATLAVGMFFLGGVQLICIGILGEYIARIHGEVKGRPGYIVDSNPKDSNGPDNPSFSVKSTDTDRTP
ncbi:glycosyltransferase family 2 protein [Pseudomonadota bacterium]